MYEALLDDGAPYPCSFSTFFGQEWRCPKDATKAVTSDMYDKVVLIWEKGNIHLHGRAFCDRHAEIVTDTANVR